MDLSSQEGQRCPDAPSILHTPSVLGSIEYMYSDTECIGVLAASTLRALGSMSSTKAPNTASTGSTNGTGPRVQAVPAVSNPAILGSTGSIRATEPRNTASTRAIPSQNTASTL